MVDVVKYARGQIYRYECNSKNSLKHGSCIQGKSRPVLILSNPVFNHHSNLVAVVPFTSKLKKLHYFSHIKVDMPEMPSMILVEQITTIDQCCLGEYIGTLSEDKMKLVEDAIMKHLGIIRSDKSKHNSTVSDHENLNIESFQESINSTTNDHENLNIEPFRGSVNTTTDNETSIPSYTNTEKSSEFNSDCSEAFKSKQAFESKKRDFSKFDKVSAQISEKPKKQKSKKSRSAHSRNKDRRSKYFSDSGSKIQFLRDYYDALQVPTDLRSEFLAKYDFDKFSTASKWVYVLRKELKEEGLLQ